MSQDRERLYEEDFEMDFGVCDHPHEPSICAGAVGCATGCGPNLAGHFRAGTLHR